MHTFPVRSVALAALLLLCCPGGASPQEAPAPRWWKGNTHTHTLWSDGKAAPELVTRWYRDHGYQFLVLSDHHVLSTGERWFPIKEKKGRLTSRRLAELREAFGDAWVVVREGKSGPEMRLKTLTELRAHFEAPGEFLMIQGEELTSSFGEHPIHVNGLNLAERIPAQKGRSVREVLQKSIDAILAQGRRLERPVLAHVNHPNYQWALTTDDLARITGDRFFEVYNGHHKVRNQGDAEHPSLEAMWDAANHLRLTELNLPLLYGLATDDAHDYHSMRPGKGSNPGRGWVMVRSATLDAESIIRAMQAGEFYSSSGVVVDAVETSEQAYAVHVRAEEGVTYQTQFIGTRRGPDAVVGEVLHQTAGNPAVYTYQGDELTVRARVASSRPHPNPYAKGDRETAWLQPVVVGE